MVIVEPLVSEEKLRQLLDEQAELVSLDYKSACDLRDRGALVELAKDVAVMEVHGVSSSSGPTIGASPSGICNRTRPGSSTKPRSGQNSAGAFRSHSIF
jgi:hypothetical protein